jgi:alginate O-acetyltransferase complex protein AlgI
MLFNSLTFIFLFMPITVVAYFMSGRLGFRKFSLGVIIASSFIFYGWWEPKYLWIILISILFNYAVFLLLTQISFISRRRFYVLTTGVIVNLAILGYFKYAGFLTREINSFGSFDIDVVNVLLPIGLSFFTFQQIAFLVDARRGFIKDCSLLDYSVFVLFFPQLIAGPIVHHREMMPQFQKSNGKFKVSNFNIGFSLFCIGLFKKVVLADNIALFSSPVFAISAQGVEVTLIEGWIAALGYTFQIYFDFSGYSDMAMGLARIFGVQLVINFHSPYKSNSIIEFWKRWHISLSRFLRDYVYIPLGGNRKGLKFTYFNIFIVMVLGGIWHGASWNFFVWGAIHAVYIVINHFWRQLREAKVISLVGSKFFQRVSGRFLTFILIAIAWVYFRAENLDSANRIVESMLGLNGLSFPKDAIIYSEYFLQFGKWVSFDGVAQNVSYSLVEAFIWLLILLCFVWTMPNSNQIMSKFHGSFNEYQFTDIFRNDRRKYHWKPNYVCAVIISGIFILSLTEIAKSKSEFLYFQF